MSDIIYKKYKISVHTINNCFLIIYAVEFYKNFLPLRDKIEAVADFVRTSTRQLIICVIICVISEF